MFVSYLQHLFEYIGTQFPPPSSLRVQCLYYKPVSNKFYKINPLVEVTVNRKEENS
jgi:hypothetical protein